MHRSDGLQSNLDVLYTPGHTDDSYSFVTDGRVFAGDTPLIRGTGRTDLRNGDPRAQYDSIFNKLLRLPDETQLYPAHDYKGDTVSTIGERKRHGTIPSSLHAPYTDLQENLGVGGMLRELARATDRRIVWCRPPAGEAGHKRWSEPVPSDGILL